MNPEQTAIVVTRTLQGVPGRSIADELGTSHTSVYRTQRDPAIKQKIEHAADHIINRGLQPAVKTLCRLAAMGNIKGQDKDNLKLSLDASKHITSMAGLSGGAPGTIINAMIQINQAPEQSQELTAIAAFLASQWQRDTITVTPEQWTDLKTDRPDDTEMIGIPTPHTPAQTGDVIEVEAQESKEDQDDASEGTCG